MTDEPFTVCITVAAQHLGRSLDTVRRWSRRGRVAGIRIDVHRDPMTGIRYFRRSQIEDIRAALRGRARIATA